MKQAKYGKPDLRRNEMMVGAVQFLSLIRRFDALFKKSFKKCQKKSEKRVDIREKVMYN